MKSRSRSRIWRLCLPASIALAWGLLGTGTAHAQVQMAGVEQPRLSPAGVHVHFKNITVIPRDEKSAIIQFDITWSGAWRHDVNHDAAWVFFKVRVDGEKPWQPVRLAADKVLNPTGFGQEGGTKLDFIVPKDEGEPVVGMFVRLADHGEGPASGTKVTAVWDLAPHKDIKKDTKVRVKAYGLKMVYVAEGSYYLGGPAATETYAFYQYPAEKKQRAESQRLTSTNSTMVVREEVDAVAEFPPYLVTNSAAIPTGKQPGRLWASGAEPQDGGEIPATFPNGYNAFYMMERPIPQGAYAFFLNSLSPEDAHAHYQPEGHPIFGKIARLGDGPDYTYEFQHGRLKSLSVWWLCWSDGAAFSAWAGLRPMTELEYEKSLRGPRYPVPTEAAHSFWGGSFGGGRYNAHPRERPVTVGNAIGRAFKGTHGDGTLKLPADWPKDDAVGVGMRGSQECASGPPELRGPWWCTSCRIDAATVDPERNVTYGFRGARTAPEEAKWNSVRNEEESSPVLKGLPSNR